VQNLNFSHANFFQLCKILFSRVKVLSLCLIFRSLSLQMSRKKFLKQLTMLFVLVKPYEFMIKVCFHIFLLLFSFFPYVCFFLLQKHVIMFTCYSFWHNNGLSVSVDKYNYKATSYSIAWFLRVFCLSISAVQSMLVEVQQGDGIKSGGRMILLFYCCPRYFFYQRASLDPVKRVCF
jgi:hypothetical protein